MRILVVGAGSIGRRHLRNLRALGLGPVAVCEPDDERREAVPDELRSETFASFEKALTGFEPDAVLVCTPPVAHVPQSRAALAAGAHVFVEKPLSDSLEGIAELESEAASAGKVVQVGYNLHFERSLVRVKELVDGGAVGAIRWAQIEFGQYLPDWRPWMDYRESYTARRELGGGILLDASHEIAYAIWLLGEPVAAVSMAGHVSPLEVDVEDCATVLIRFASGAQADVHVDFVRRDVSRSCVLTGDLGTIVWDAIERTVLVRRPGEPDRLEELPGEDDDAYREELRQFFSAIAAGTDAAVGLRLARQALELALDARNGAAL
ncbi:MAG TPA: Gfo/Idh/MocA family oxidoreductase [Gaiellaceae bacterium]